ncbi:MAG: Crp/Fnr family transcriptional regulator [Daejeonella sp.]|uniref:Crp/Fnr family transcriptional regulator n=1 Tax=Daejeonella sp. TaxID=2805397 RepID=UPI003C721FC0
MADQPSQPEPLIAYFRQYFPLNAVEKSEAGKFFTERTIRRRQFILQEGDVCNHFTFIVSGCFKMYAVTEDAKEHILQFSTENEWISDLNSFYSREPSKLFIEALEPALILQIKHQDLLHLFTSHHKFDRNFRIVVERAYIQLQERMLANISSSAEQRYEQFLKNNPELARRLPGTQIASYLGITPEFLSKIRKSIVGKSHKS